MARNPRRVPQAPPGMGTLVVLSAPSGCGKSTVVERWLKENPNLVRSVSASTRTPRPGEVEGRDYFFVSREEFQKKQSQAALLESAQVFGEFYGTPREAVEKQLGAGRDVVLVIDVQGARAVRREHPCLSIFLAPPSLKELRRRLVHRGGASGDELELRFSQAREEMACAREFDHSVINDTVERTVRELDALLQARKGLRT